MNDPDVTAGTSQPKGPAKERLLTMRSGGWVILLAVVMMCLVLLQAFQHLGKQRIEVDGSFCQFRDSGEYVERILSDQRIQQPAYLVTSNNAEHIDHFRFTQTALAKSNRLISDRQRVAHAAASRLANDRQRSGLKFDSLFGENLLEIIDGFFSADIFKLKLQTPGQHGDRHLLRVRSSEQKFNVLGRFFQRLQQGIEAGR